MRPFLIQSGEFVEAEKRALRTLSITGKSLDRAFCSMEDLAPGKFPGHVPIGTVEFTRAYCAAHGITLPELSCYPEHLRDYLDRDVWQSTFAEVQPDQFVKPLRVKTFTGGICGEITERVAGNEPVWVANPIPFTNEFRFYVTDGTVDGWSQYGEGNAMADEVVTCSTLVRSLLEAWCLSGEPMPAGFSVDVGIVDRASRVPSLGDPGIVGKSNAALWVGMASAALVEINDGWALGFYPWGTFEAEDYVRLLQARWQEILDNQP